MLQPSGRLQGPGVGVFVVKLELKEGALRVQKIQKVRPASLVGAQGGLQARLRLRKELLVDQCELALLPAKPLAKIADLRAHPELKVIQLRLGPAALDLRLFEPGLLLAPPKRNGDSERYIERVPPGHRRGEIALAHVGVGGADRKVGPEGPAREGNLRLGLLNSLPQGLGLGPIGRRRSVPALNPFAQFGGRYHVDGLVRGL